MTDAKETEDQFSVHEDLEERAKKYGTDILSSDFAHQMDASDKLAYLRNEFHYPKCGTLAKVDHSLVDDEEDSIYFCGNSIGLQPKRTSAYIERELDKWAKMGVQGHRHGVLPWEHSDEKLVDQTAKLIGAKPNEVAVMNSLTINQHLLLISFYQPTPTRNKVLMESRAFPSDHYAVESQIQLRGYNPKECMICIEPREGEVTLRTEDIERVLEEQGEQIATVMLPGIQYYTGQLLDMETITKAAHKQGCYVGFDLAHAVGNVKLRLHDWAVDFACWCTYKYLNSGAGGWAGAFIHERFDEADLPRLVGWWSHKMSSRFNMDNKIDLSEGASGFRISNPPMLLAASLQASLDIFSMTDIADLRHKSRLLTGYLEYLLKRHFPKPEVEEVQSQRRPYVTILTPTDPRWRGCQLSVMFSHPVTQVFVQLEKRGVVCDKREPDVLRFAPTPLYNSFTDVHRFVHILQEAFEAVASGS